MWDKTKNQFCYRLSNKRKAKSQVFRKISKKTSNTKSVLFVFRSNFSNQNNFCPTPILFEEGGRIVDFYSENKQSAP